MYGSSHDIPGFALGGLLPAAPAVATLAAAQGEGKAAYVDASPARVGEVIHVSQGWTDAREAR